MADIVVARISSSVAEVANDPLLPFGLEFIDAEIDGLIERRLYLLYGPHPAWKMSIALYFIHQSLISDQRAAYITSHDPDAVMLQAQRLGFNLHPYLKSGQLVLLNYLPRLSQQVALLPDYQPVIQELKRLIGPSIPERIVFDPVEMLIHQENKSSVLPSTRLLIEALKNLNATLLCLVDESEEPHVQTILKEFLFLSFGAFQVQLEPDDTRVFLFQKVIWNPREYPRIPLTLRSKRGHQVLEPASRFNDARASQPIPLHPEDIPEPIALPKPMALLVVDDDPLYPGLLQDGLGSRYRIDATADPVEAISKMVGSAHDAILVNLDMPRIDGRELCLRLRQYHPDMPLVAFSNKHKRSSDVAGVLRVGADQFLSRPLEFNLVRATLQAAIRRPSGPRSFERVRAYNQRFLEQLQLIRNVTRQDPHTHLERSDFFELKVCSEIEKSEIADYGFSLVAYIIPAAASARDVEARVHTTFRAIIRNDDMVMSLGPARYLVYLDECLEAGVRRFNDRLRKALQHAVGRPRIQFRHQCATYPMDGTSWETLKNHAIDGLLESDSGANSGAVPNGLRNLDPLGLVAEEPAA